MTLDWNPGEKYTTLVNRISDLLGDEERTVRDVYYALESRGYDYDYREVKRAVKKGRRAGYIDPSKIIDASRTPEVTPSGYSSPESFVRRRVQGCWNYYNEDEWANQDHYVEVWLEKQSLASVFAPICEEYNVRLEATRGDWSDSKVYEACQRLGPKISEGRDVVILYFGDFNPSGFHAPVAIQETMNHYGVPTHRPTEGSHYFDIWPPDGPTQYQRPDGGDGGTLYFDRIAINPEHIERFDLPENPNPSSTDKDAQLKERFMRYVADRDTNVELNALKEFERGYLEDAIGDAITERIDQERWAETEERVEEGRESIEDAISIDWDAL